MQLLQPIRRGRAWLLAAVVVGYVGVVSTSAQVTIQRGWSTVSAALSFAPDNTLDLGAAGGQSAPHRVFRYSVVSPLVTARYVTSGSAPTVSNTGANTCGTTAATIAGNENSGIITVGATSGTSCTLTFPTAAPTRRSCVANNESTANLVRGIYLTTTTSKLDGTFVAGDVLTYYCVAR